MPVAKTLKPVVSTLQGIKSKIDLKVAEQPQNKMYPMFSDMINNALEQKDESRRAAMLNTLMQYKSFREMFKDEMPEE
jgi:hypothetical protein